MMKTHEIILIPGAGYADGKYSRGCVVPTISEVDIVDRYLGYIADELENMGARYKIMPTRKPPGVPDEERLKRTIVNTLILDCRIGWADSKKNNHNISTVSVGANCREIGELLCESLKEWGSLYVFGHRGANPHYDETLGENTIQIFPFKLNGPNALDYCLYLDKLGRDIGRAVGAFVTSKFPAKASQIFA